MHIKIVPAQVLTLLIMITATDIIAQKNVQKFEFGAGLAGFVYQGDLTPNPAGSFGTIRPGIVLSAAKILNSSFIFRANISIGGLRGDETNYQYPAYRKFRAFQFHTPLVEISPQLVWNPLGRNDAEKGFSPYLFGGAAISFFNIKRDASRFDVTYFGEGSDIPVNLVADEQHVVPKAKIVIPVGAGVRYNISNRIAINAEETYRFPFTDYLDGFSKAANPKLKDHYHSIMVGIIYRVGNKNKLDCPAQKY
jgi:hypothetical protein